MLAGFSVHKSKYTEKKEKATRKLKMSLNQQVSRQPFTLVPGRASLVKRTFYGPFGL
jgi:hypothetical protein